jgi:Zn-dependent protease
VRAITLWMLGGITELGGDPPDAGADLRIAVAGPAASAVAAGVFLGIAQAVRYAGGPAVVTAGLVWFAVMNGMLAVFNMLPGAPLDGGRVLRAVLWRHYGDRRRAEIAAARAGQFLGAGIISARPYGGAVWPRLRAHEPAPPGAWAASLAGSRQRPRCRDDSDPGPGSSTFQPWRHLPGS